MFLLRSEKELVDSFFPKDQKRLELPKDVKFPLVVRDYFAWTDSSNGKVFLVFAEPDVKKPIGVMFEKGWSSGGAPASICEWCHSYGSGGQIGLLTLEASSKRRVGAHLCLDLSCHDKIESNLSLTPMGVQSRKRHVVESMSRFVRRTIL